MPDIDILNIQPTQICKDLRGRFVLLYGLPKSGKTSTSSMWPKPLLCAFEKGYNALIGVRPVDIDKWSTFKQICRQLKAPEAKEQYQTLIIDTVSIAARLCEKYVCQREGVDALGDIGYGRGWNMYKEELETTFRELTQLGYAIVFLCHSKEYKSEMVDEEGNAMMAQQPDLTNSVRTIINGLVDIIGYISVQFDKEGNSSRYIYTRSTPTVFAGSRYKYLASKIPLSYQNLVDAVAEAMEKEAAETGTQLLDENQYKAERSVAVKQEREFPELMDLARNFWMKYLESAENDEQREERLNKMNSIVFKIFGKVVKLSTVQPAQRDLLELVVDEFANCK